MSLSKRIRAPVRGIVHGSVTRHRWYFRALGGQAESDQELAENDKRPGGRRGHRQALRTSVGVAPKAARKVREKYAGEEKPQSEATSAMPVRGPVT